MKLSAKLALGRAVLLLACVTLGIGVGACKGDTEPAANLTPEAGSSESTLAESDSAPTTTEVASSTDTDSDITDLTRDAASTAAEPTHSSTLGPDGGDPSLSSSDTRDAGSTSGSFTTLDAAVSDPLDSGSGEDRDAALPDAGRDASLVDSGDAGPSEPEPPLWDEAGFIDIEEHGIELSGAAFTVPNARLFYSFQIADHEPEKAPLYVLFNGGPGYPASSALLVNGTGRYRLDFERLDGSLVPTTTSFTQLGNVLYIDPRQTGFSYGTLPEPPTLESVVAASEEEQHNLFADAADFVRVVLRVMRARPALLNNRVILVGQSYGGLRSALMLYGLLSPSFWDSIFYRDLSLFAEVNQHFADQSAAPELSHQERVQQQFTHQILIQPGYDVDYLQGERCLEGSPELVLSQQLGEECPPPSRDEYDISRPAAFLSAASAAGVLALTTPETSQQLLRVDLRAVPGLKAADRTHAYKSYERNDAVLSSVWLETQGAVGEWDHYFTAGQPQSNSWTQTNVSCQVLAHVVSRVKTFITHAPLDMVVDTRLVPRLLQECAGGQLVSAAQIDTQPREGVARPGWIQVTFAEGNAFASGTREIRWPEYSNAGHAVTVNAGQEFFEDVSQFVHEP